MLETVNVRVSYKDEAKSVLILLDLGCDKTFINNGVDHALDLIIWKRPKSFFSEFFLVQTKIEPVIMGSVKGNKKQKQM